MESKRISVTENDLLAAIREVKPVAPSAEWMTITEMVAAFQRSDPEIGSAGRVRRRLRLLEKDGKLERTEGPRRGVGSGRSVYYRLKP